MSQQELINQQAWAKLKPLTSSAIEEIILTENPHFISRSPSQENNDVSCKIYQDKQNQYWIERTFPRIGTESLAGAILRRPLQIGSVLCLNQQQNAMEDYIFEPLMETYGVSHEDVQVEVQKSPEVPEEENQENDDSPKQNNCLNCKYFTLSEVIMAPCLHTFCDSCVSKFKQGTQKCPMCNEVETPVTGHTSANSVEHSGRSVQGRVYVEELLGYYEGEWLGEKPHGIGKITFCNGRIYEGEVKNGKPDGQGKMNQFFKEIYEGQWKDGMKEGKGKLVFFNGESYEGEFKADKMEGYGKWVLTKKRQEVYEGEMKDDKKDGFGKSVFGDGTVYVGEYKDGLIHGKGKIVYFSGEIYEGEFRNHKKNGEGRLFKTNGKVLKGKWIEGKYQSSFKTFFNKLVCTSSPRK